MSKQLKDYLHLYLGCEVSIEGVATNKLLSIDTDGNMELSFRKTQVHKWGADEIGRMKLILRPISDMTEDEWKELVIFIQPVVDQLHDDNHISQGEVDAERTRWALSKGFDLFQLIESGLAIDKTKNQ